MGDKEYEAMHKVCDEYYEDGWMQPHDVLQVQASVVLDVSGWLLFLISTVLS